MRAVQKNINLGSVIAGVVTASPCSKEVVLTPGGLRAVRVDMKVSGVTVVGSISVILQHGNEVLGWVDAATAAVTTNGVVSIKLLDTVAADQTQLPLGGNVRIVTTTTNAGDEVTFDAMLITM